MQFRGATLCGPHHYGMSHPQVVGGEYSLQTWRIAENMLNKQSWTASKGWSSRWGVGWGTNNSSPQKTSLLWYVTQGLRLWHILCNNLGKGKWTFWCKRSTGDQIFCICQILEKNWDYNRTIPQLFIDFEEACCSGEKYSTIFLLNLVYLWNKLG